MKIICVVDSINGITKKVDALRNRFGNDIIFVVKANLENLFTTYGYTINAVYTKNMSKIVSQILSSTEATDTIVYYTSLDLTNELLNRFILCIDDKSKIVNVKPNYNFFEKIYNKAYNIYVKSLFKIDDSFASKKLQFLPKDFVAEIKLSHFGNRLFDIPEKTTTIEIEDKDTSKQLKVEKSNYKMLLYFLIIALVITSGLIISLAFNYVKFWLVLIFIFAYISNITICSILSFKQHFDKRFLK